MWKDIEGLQRS